MYVPRPAPAAQQPPPASNTAQPVQNKAGAAAAPKPETSAQ
jgi:hypothetical protein